MSPIISGTVFSKLIFRVLKEITQHLDHHVHDLLSRQFESLFQKSKQSLTILISKIINPNNNNNPNNPYFKNITKNN